MEKQRIYLFDNLKFFLIITVVIGHFADYAIEYPDYKALFLFIYAFHMPLFLFISGVFHKNNKILEKVLIYTLLGYLLKAFIYFTTIAVDKKITFSLFTEKGAPWFMFAMAVFTLVSYLLRDIDKKFVLLFSLFIACLAGYDSNIGDFLCLSRLLVFFPFYHMGTMFHIDAIKDINSKKSNKLISAAILLIWTFVCTILLDKAYILRPLFTGRNPFEEAWYPFGGLYRFFCYSLTIALIFAFISLVPDKNLPFFTKFGARTMQVYFWHRPILYVIDAVGITAICTTGIGRAIFILMSIVLSFLLSAKIFSFPTNQLLGLRDKLKLNIKS